jgi:hypothetical protein
VLRALVVDLSTADPRISEARVVVIVRSQLDAVAAERRNRMNDRSHAGV